MRLKNIVCFLFVNLFFLSCYYSHSDVSDQWNDLAEDKVDSVAFFASHHYWKGSFFYATDSMKITHEIDCEHTSATVCDCPLQRISTGDVIGVLDIRRHEQDSVSSFMIKVARDQQCQGWIEEATLLKYGIPDSPIAKFIHYFSSRNFFFVLFFVVIATILYVVQVVRKKTMYFVHFNDIRSFYPTLLCLTVSFGAVLYGSLQKFAPETWEEFYFNPTLNPFQNGLPLILSLFVVSLWLMLFVGLAVVDDIWHLPDFSGKISYLAGLIGVCMILYLFFTLSVHAYIGYPLLLVYWVFAFYRHFKHGVPHFCCGECGAPISNSGRCSECGADNEI